jgi:predicted alpha-1,6-mannanase (GH76 family)
MIRKDAVFTSSAVKFLPGPGITAAALSASLSAMLTAALILAVSCGGPPFKEAVVNYDKESVYYRYANEAVESLLKNYWNSEGQLFYDKYPQKTADVLNYWWAAHAIDVMADAYLRTGDAAYQNYADMVMKSVFKKNGSVIHEYYDDMEWMALALLRLYNATGDNVYRTHAETLWQDITTGWNDTMGGGIAWKKTQIYYKNTPANAPAAILAARLYNLTKNKACLDWAKKIFAFLDEKLVDHETGEVYDGINRQFNGRIDKDWRFTYCQGVYIGAAVELYKITGDKAYLDKALLTADFSLKQFVGADGCFVEEGAGGDVGLFKGILIRYLAELYKINPGLPAIKDTLNKNVEILRGKGTNASGCISSLWSKAPEEGAGSDLSVQLSGVMLYEMALVINSISSQ